MNWEYNIYTHKNTQCNKQKNREKWEKRVRNRGENGKQISKCKI